MLFYVFDKLLKTKKSRLQNLMLLIKKATGSNIKFFLVQNQKDPYVGMKPQKTLCCSKMKKKSYQRCQHTVSFGFILGFPKN